MPLEREAIEEVRRKGSLILEKNVGGVLKATGAAADKREHG